MGNDFENLLLGRKDWSWNWDKVFVKPKIPAKKLLNALSYAPGVNPDDVLILVDDTVFGGAKDGFLVTQEAIFCHELMTPKKQISLHNIKEICIGEKTQILINKQKFFKGNIVDHFALLAITTRINSVLNELQGTSNSHENDLKNNSNRDQSFKPQSLNKTSTPATDLYGLNFIAHDEYFSAIKKIDNIHKASSVVDVFLGGSNKERPITKINDDFSKKIYKSVFEFRRSLIEEAGIVKLANDLTTFEVGCYTSAKILGQLTKHSIHESVLSSIIERALPDALFINSENMNNLALSIIEKYMQEKSPIFLFNLRIFISNKERQLLDSIEPYYHHIKGTNAGEANNQIMAFTSDNDQRLQLFDRKVNELARKFVSNTLNTIYSR
ncbi:hypothetical protein [Vreelandella venusta]|uniref:hypothetical protein n=1 Tax=Vreelandella venusta TaxID=44935 RepID=UPI003850B638